MSMVRSVNANPYFLTKVRNPLHAALNDYYKSTKFLGFFGEGDKRALQLQGAVLQIVTKDELLALLQKQLSHLKIEDPFFKVVANYHSNILINKISVCDVSSDILIQNILPFLAPKDTRSLQTAGQWFDCPLKEPLVFQHLLKCMKAKVVNTDSIKVIIENNPRILFFKQPVNKSYSPLEYSTAYHYALSLKNPPMRTMFQKYLSQDALKNQLNHLSLLLQQVAYGALAEAEEIITLYPELLLERGYIKDLSGREFDTTPLGFALAAEDVRYHEDEECMAEMIMRHLRKMDNGEAIIQAQKEAQFPAGWLDQEKQREKNDLAALHKVLDAIAASEKNEDCEAALEEFRQYLKPKGVITTGKHFNMQLLVEAFKLYNDNYEQFGNEWNSRKNILSWRKVIGYIQRYVPANYAQAFAQGIYDIVNDGAKLKRSFEFRYSPGHFMFPLDLNPSSRLGFDFVGTREGAYGPCGRQWQSRFLQTMSNKKHQSTIDYLRSDTCKVPGLSVTVR